MRRSQRPDLIYREQLAAEKPDYPVFDAITEKVMQHLMSRNIEQWEPDHWKVYQALLNANTRAPLNRQSQWHDPSQKAMRADSLRDLLRSVTNGDDP